MNDNITLPRSVVEHVMYHLNRGDDDAVCWADGVIKPALEQPVAGIPATVSPGWRLVPMELTPEMRKAGSEAVERRKQRSFNGAVQWDYVFRAILAAAPQPPTTEQSSAVEQPPAAMWRELAIPIRAGHPDDAGFELWWELHMPSAGRNDAVKAWNAAQPKPQTPAAPQPKGEQEPVAVIGYDWTLFWVGCGPIGHIVKKHGLKIGDKLYTHPQPKREPQFDAFSVDQEQLAIQFCAEIAGPRGGRPSLPDPVRLLEMAEALYQAEVQPIGAVER